MGLAADGLKNYTQAMHYHQEAISIFEMTGDRAGIGYALSRMSLGAYLLGNYENALRYGQEGYDAFEEIGHRWGICISFCRIGFAHLGMGDIRKAKDRLHEALCLARENQMTPLILHALAGLACAMVKEGETERPFELYQIFRSHPQTPAIYLDTAEAFFSDLDMPAFQDEPVASGVEYDDETLDQVVEAVLKELP
jgi:tetratricopeptide (TPR) repeat protein